MEKQLPSNRAAASVAAAFLLLASWPALVVEAAGPIPPKTATAIPWNQIGAKAGADYQGDGLAVTPATSGARLHCVFQRLDGEATPEGLWLTSTVTNTVNDRFRVTAIAVGRSAFSVSLPGAGEVSVNGQMARMNRPGLTEEYTVSMDGVRQDFIVEESPTSPRTGELVLKLAVRGARVEPAADGARLVLENSGRKIAYNRLRVTDATGKELPARMEVSPAQERESGFDSWLMFEEQNEEMCLLAPASAREDLVVEVNDAGAVYPLRIDPTFSDANWVSLGGLPGTDGMVNAAAVDSSGNLYIGGSFIIVGNINATNIAEWNGNTWSDVSGGINGGYVGALAVSGDTLFVGGAFTNAGGITASNIAQWNGNGWSALGSGMSGKNHSYGFGPLVNALAVSGGTLYAGGAFSTAGGVAANNIAQWNGNAWSALGSGLTGLDENGLYPFVSALAVSGGTLYAGGAFSTAGGVPANEIAQWNGNAWSALGSGMSGWELNTGESIVYSLAVSAGTLYAGGYFSTAGGVVVNCIAQWNGNSWSALGEGISGQDAYGDGPVVDALAVSGGTLFVGGVFSTAGTNAADSIAQWNGNAWSGLGSGMSGEVVSVVSGDTTYSYPMVSALAVSGGILFAGGVFSTAGTNAANSIAQWNGNAWSALGEGFAGGNAGSPYVTSMAVSGGNLYAGGNFTWVGTNAANYVVKWNGSSWTALASG